MEAPRDRVLEIGSKREKIVIHKLESGNQTESEYGDYNHLHL